MKDSRHILTELCDLQFFSGDKEKVKLPVSNYKQSFPTDQLSKLDAAVPAQFHTPSVLRGDTRSYEDQFETTNSKTFGERVTPVKLQPIKV